MASFAFSNLYIKDAYTVAGPLEKEGQIKKFDATMDDYYFQEKTFEKAEIKMQRLAIESLMHKHNLNESTIDFMVGGDLSNQIAITNYTASKYEIPFLGVYSACATFAESIIIAANAMQAKDKKTSIVITSSHNLTAEKQFRFPIEYGAPKPKRSTFTATASVAALLTKEPSHIKVESATLGIPVDMGIKDAFHMGAVMAPAAASTLVRHLEELKRDVNYYDLILTGDLGSVGSDILKEFLKQTHGIKLKNHMDAGTEIYQPYQETYSGASGPVALPLVLFNKVIKSKRYKKILCIATGSLHSPVMVNQKNSIPAIAHAISLEVEV